jgi:hypothetical protein
MANIDVVLIVMALVAVVMGLVVLATWRLNNEVDAESGSQA